MPELPDVEVFRRYFRRSALGRAVKHVAVEDDRVVAASPSTLRRRLVGRRFARTRRHGKYLFAELDDGRALVFHFGMTGFLQRLRAGEPLPDHARVVLSLDDQGRLAYDNQRLFGRVYLTDDADAFIADRRLGPDALAVDRDRLASLLRGRRGKIKAALVDQHLIAGIGNIYADEILFHARIDPDTPAAELDPRQIAALHRAMQRVLRGAVDARVDVERMPRSWLLPHRDTDRRCPRCRHALERRRHAGRSTWLCPRCQRSARVSRTETE